MKVPTSWLFVVSMGALAVDVALVGADAEAEEVMRASRRPDRVPAMAFLTGPVQQAGTVAGLDARIEPEADGAFALVLDNPADTPADVQLEVKTYAQNGQFWGRMGPVTELKHTESVTASLQPGEQRRHRLGWMRKTPVSAESADILALDNAIVFDTASFELRADDEVLRLAEKAPE